MCRSLYTSLWSHDSDKSNTNSIMLNDNNICHGINGIGNDNVNLTVSYILFVCGKGISQYR